MRLASDRRYRAFTDESRNGFMMSIRTLRMSGNITLKNWQFVAPGWVLGGLCVAVAGLPWLRWRFSLRTLLIVTTLVAVVLGLAVYAGRK
jgi:hypothetical protein